MVNYLSKIIKINDVNVVGVTKTDTGEVFSVLTVKKKGNKIAILSQRTFETFEKLKSKIDVKLPILLVVDGKGVLNKEINYNVEADVNWKKNIDYNSIYFTSYRFDNVDFISFCRKSNVEEITNIFKKNDLQIIDVYVGSFLSALLYSSIEEEKIISGDLELLFQEKQLIGFSKRNESTRREYKIGDDIIFSNELPLYGAILHFYIKPNDITKTQDVNLNIEEVIYKKAFAVLGVTMLIGFFVSLLLSYVLIQYYGAKNNELNLQNIYSNKSYQKIVDLEKQREEKLNIIKQSGTFSNKYLTFYAYSIIKSVPNAVSLTELNIFPSGKEIKKEKKIQFESSTIRIKGETFKEDQLNQWLNNIKANQWIKKFEIVSLKKDKNNNTLFEIKIVIKNV